MKIADLLLQDFDIEMRGTRATLERIPESLADYQPHPKSMPMGRLAVHVARLPRFLTTILQTPSLDLASIQFPPMVYESKEKLLSEFDTEAAEARRLLEGASDADLEQHWQLAWGGRTLADAPRAALSRTLFLNHLIHHRAQLGMYLRLNDLPLPALYGPTADDPK
ncbi:MAG TPA: DinB family protein [Holophaga sp.]|nr:DinB family protein [Holophaga sp.]